MGLNSTAAKHLETLRNRQTGLREFRLAAHGILPELFGKLKTVLKERNMAEDTVAFVIILRAASVFLNEVLKQFPGAPIAVAGLRRDEKTAIAHWYYENFPPISQHQTIVILDPMLATGGSAAESVLNVQKRGADPKKIFFLGYLAAPEGIEKLAKHILKENIIVAAIDAGLDDKKFIVPGLGDFGDRYFGTPQ